MNNRALCEKVLATQEVCSDSAKLLTALHLFNLKSGILPRITVLNLSVGKSRGAVRRRVSLTRRTSSPNRRHSKGANASARIIREDLFSRSCTKQHCPAGISNDIDHPDDCEISRRLLKLGNVRILRSFGSRSDRKDSSRRRQQVRR